MVSRANHSGRDLLDDEPDQGRSGIRDWEHRQVGRSSSVVMSVMGTVAAAVVVITTGHGYFPSLQVPLSFIHHTLFGLVETPLQTSLTTISDHSILI